MTEADLSVTVEGGSNLVKVRGDIDMETAPRLAECLDRVEGSASVDCAGLDFLDFERHRGVHPGPEGLRGSW